ncbi:Chromosome partition protein Smc [Pseudomonas saudimassiliensis]|uniref:Chromosome partition protein Smc n=1 Tax=Pseudomonas saudimassiliensis TaxID=1461581 RepID=A0A078MMX4_9PSED|nr:AAA family ATPase [Pseudomonas saudimassiliensis]CEA06126.1 Chromosome partition protein Smc [Pseudomonas saudimassiliensis]CEF27551.1 Chromosome partition protein Smc [Pseudomonas saudimassiliensis]
MKLQQLRISQFRQFREPLSISGFGPGLNLICGPNESGKSTLVRAIRAAFFERHSSGTLTDLRPWGDSGAAPEVELSFSHGAQQWQLSKRFLQRKRCDLTVDGERLSGDEAEERLAGMLGFSVANRGASKAEHWGIPGLLWIEQGMGQELGDAVSHAGDHLKSVLGASLGEVTSSGGDDIIKQVRGQLDELLTGTGKPRGEYKASAEQIAALTAQLQELDQRIGAYRQQVDRLDELRRQQLRDEAERPWEALRAQQQQAEARYAEVQRQSEQQQRDLQALAQAQGNRQLVLNQLRHHEEQVSDLQQRQASRLALQQQLEQLAERQAELRAARDAAVAAYQQAQQAERLARQAARRDALQREREQLQRQAQQLQQSLEQARQLQREQLTQQQALALIRVDAGQLATLEKLHNQLRELEIRQQSIAPRLRYELLPGQRLELNQQGVEGAGEQQLLEETRIAIEGVGQLLVIPGGGDLARLGREAERLREQLHSLQAQLQVDSLAAAREQWQQAQSLAATLQGNRKLLNNLAPEGVDALEQHLAGTTARGAELDAELTALAALPEADQPSPELAEQQLQQAATRLQQSEAASLEHNEQVIELRQRLASVDEECRRLQERLDDPQRRQQQQQLGDQLLAQRAEEARLEQVSAERAAQIASARPDILEQDIQRFRSSAAQLEQSFHQRRDELIALQARLQGEGADGLEESHAALTAELERETRRHRQLQRRADALALLSRLLGEQRQQLTRQLQAPLQKHLEHYLQLLFPQAALEVDENLMPSRLLRQGQDAGEFDALSFGAREQMGLISRLAYADLLREAGRPTLLILDDALVHSDQPRLEQMKRILFDAAQRHQVLLFSCHPDKWRDMGVPVRELEALKASPADGD